ncbi:DUF2779 domain-containing protein [Orrella sp. NBD-18]|uniref:DUF2779 domain-containing protein n=1 Tax=Sheuella amnicola TaxID=2707330 RepID=A0A6B2R2Z6_9BURK|nr:DUF2779 domain-containing protein [Sheuella amnicola]NDY84448.1 DUF2779 domain-containing protein [Sheuella amnicola]
MLTKSLIISHRQCPKRMWLQVNQPELAVIDPSARSRMEDGNHVGDIARQLHPDGVLISTLNRKQALTETAAVLSGTRRSVFEPAFMADDVLVRVDLLLPDGDHYRAVEVKSSTSVKPYHLDDLTVQTWVMRKSGLPLSRVSLAHINTQFVYPGHQDYQGLFHEVDLTAKVEEKIPEVADWVQAAKATLALDEVPQVVSGPQCSDPFACPFASHCKPVEQEVTEYPVEILPRGAKEAIELRKANYRDLREVPTGILKNEVHVRVHRATVNGQAELDRQASEILNALPWPRYYLDFETVATAIPLFAGVRPFEAIPFQWSCHIEQEDGTLSHNEFLAPDGEDPRRAFAETLINNLGQSGPIIVFNQSFEKGRILYLAELFPDLMPELKKVADRLFDLLVVAREHYYHPDMRGSWSIKSILPTIAPALTYSNLDVGHGMDAQDSYRKMIRPDTSQADRESLRHALLEYCQLDTYAMVVVANAFRLGEVDHS